MCMKYILTIIVLLNCIDSNLLEADYYSRKNELKKAIKEMRLELTKIPRTLYVGKRVKKEDATYKFNTVNRDLFLKYQRKAISNGCVMYNSGFPTSNIVRVSTRKVYEPNPKYIELKKEYNDLIKELKDMELGHSRKKRMERKEQFQKTQEDEREQRVFNKDKKDIKFYHKNLYNRNNSDFIKKETPIKKSSGLIFYDYQIGISKDELFEGIRKGTISESDLHFIDNPHVKYNNKGEKIESSKILIYLKAK